MDIEEMKSDLQMEKFYFAECSVTRDAIIKGERLSFDLHKELNKLEDNKYSVVLTLTINKENHDLAIKIVAIATFSMNSDDGKLVEYIMETNTVAIMFPFIRSQVSLLTTQPGMTPIILPPINTTKFKSK